MALPSVVKSVKKIATAMMNEIRTVPHPTTEATFVDNFLYPKPLMIKPINGISGTNQTSSDINKFYARTNVTIDRKDKSTHSARKKY